MTNPKNYIRATSLDEVKSAFQQYPDAYPLAGGALALGALDVPYETVIDVSAVPELSEIQQIGGEIVIGGAVKLSAIMQEDAVSVAFKRSLARTLPPNIRNNTSVMETLTVERPPLEWLTALAACDVELELMMPDGETSDLRFSLLDFVAGEGNGYALTDGIILSLTLPSLGDGTALGTAHVARTPAADPIVCAATFVQLAPGDKVEFSFAGLGGVSDNGLLEVLPLGDLSGGSLSPENIASQAEQVSHVLSPPDNFMGSADYRRHVAGTLVRRALEDAAKQLHATEA